MRKRRKYYVVGLYETSLIYTLDGDGNIEHSCALELDKDIKRVKKYGGKDTILYELVPMKRKK